MKHHLLLVTLGGGAGVMGKYLVSHLTQGILGQESRHGILLINLIGAVIVAMLSILLILYVSHGLGLHNIVLVAVLGTLAAFTCLSPKALPLLERHNSLGFMLHYGLKIISSLSAICLGALIAENLAIFF
jgi:CrcB protein